MKKTRLLVTSIRALVLRENLRYSPFEHISGRVFQFFECLIVFYYCKKFLERDFMIKWSNEPLLGFEKHASLMQQLPWIWSTSRKTYLLGQKSLPLPILQSIVKSIWDIHCSFTFFCESFNFFEGLLSSFKEDLECVFNFSWSFKNLSQ